MRNYKITKKAGELYNAEVTDSYGNEYQNYFDTEQKCINWVYYIWEKEDWFNSANSQELLGNAIADCIKIDEENGLTPKLD